MSANTAGEATRRGAGAQRGVDARATYRIQLRNGMGFAEVAALGDYLAALGISHAYLSPPLTAAPGSTHGYDIVDPTRMDPALGGDDGFTAMADVLKARGIRLLVDIVPNHLAIGQHDPWWWDVLEHGRASRHAAAFDIDWSVPDERIVLPILGERYGAVVANGGIAFERRGGSVDVKIAASDVRLPAAPRALGTALGSIADGHAELAAIADGLAALPAPWDLPAAEERHRLHAMLRDRLARLCEREPAIAARIDAGLAVLAADPERLDAFLQKQNWRLAHWRTSASELGYRRFFDVAGLVGVRVEDSTVFVETHGAIVRHVERGAIDGLRVDHVDGLRAPCGYLARLRAAAPDAWIVVEKILAPGERVPARWPIEGTTGYDFMRLCDAAFVAPDAAPALRESWLAAGGDPAPWEEVARAARLQILDETLASERDQLVGIAHAHAQSTLAMRDATRRELADALTELLAAFPVYRTYIRIGEVPREEDRAVLESAIATAAARRPEIDGLVWIYLRAALGGSLPGADELCARFQQLAPAVMAKGIEDTAGYRATWYPLLDDVGGAPDRFGIALDELHAELAALPAGSLCATATHDTKRGEDVRARMVAISERPHEWAATVAAWRARVRSIGAPAIDPALESLWWFTAACAWPLDEWRGVAYLVKAAREEKRATSWLRPDDAYEQRVGDFVRAALGDAELRESIGKVAAAFAPAARRSSLARTLLKLTAPGVPDFYQGTELWDASLVDPDNRRPVDFGVRREALAEVAALDAVEVLARDAARPGLAKLWLIRELLHVRAAHPDWFAAPYVRLDADGPAADRVLAFARGPHLAIVLPRAPGTAGWAETTLTPPPGLTRELLTGRDVGAGPLDLAALWSAFPVAVLVAP